MANECETHIIFESSEEGLKWLKEKVGEVLKLKDEDRVNFISENFGVRGETTFDKLGTRWVDIIETEDSEEEFIIKTLSSKYPPDKMIINLVSLLIENFDRGSRASGKYWDENFSTIGIFESNSTGYHHVEDSLDVDFDNENYWEEEVEPAFDKLEL